MLTTSNVSKFLAYAKDNGILVNAENFMTWDTDHNASDEHNAIIHRYGSAAIYAVGLKELFQRRLFSAVRFSIPKGHVILPVGSPPTSGVQKGISVRTMTIAQQDYVLDETTKRWKNDARRLKMWGLSTVKLHKLLDEALQN